MSTLPDHFWAKVEKTETCWIWTHCLAQGYGRFGSATNAAYKDYGTALAYKIAWEAEHGPVPDGLELDHTCNNPACVRPSHLEPVTHAENCRRPQPVAATPGAAARPGSGESTPPSPVTPH